MTEMSVIDDTNADYGLFPMFVNGQFLTILAVIDGFNDDEKGGLGLFKGLFDRKGQFHQELSLSSVSSLNHRFCQFRPDYCGVGTVPFRSFCSFRR